MKEKETEINTERFYKKNLKKEWEKLKQTVPPS